MHIAPRYLGRLRVPPEERRRSPRSPARGRRGLCSGGAGQPRAPPSPRLRRAGDAGGGGCGTGTGPRECCREAPSLGFRSFAPFLFPNLLGLGRRRALRGRRDGGGEPSPLRSPPELGGRGVCARRCGPRPRVCGGRAGARGGPFRSVLRSRFGSCRAVPGRCLVISEDLLSRCFGAAGGRCGRAPGPGGRGGGRGGCSGRADPRGGGLWQGTKADSRAGRGQARTRARARGPPRAPPREARGLAARGSAPGATLAEPARPLTAAFAKGRVNERHLLPSHPQRCGQIARVAALLLFVKQALSLGRGARGMWRIPGKDYINQSIISPEKSGTNRSKS